MTVLADHIRVRGRFARSANLERDADRTEPLDGYVVTARALDVVERVALAAATGPSGGAWTLTGPYGSGKSSLALLLDAALGPPVRRREIAWKLIDEVSPATAALVRQAHQRHHTWETGFHRGLVTANREPINHTVLRALHAAVLRASGRIPPASRFRAASTLRGAINDATASDPRRPGPSPTAVVEIARCLAEDAPLLLIVDEFGKSLEAIRDESNADPYVLQQLVEAGQGSGLPIFVITLQHVPFEDYLTVADGPQRREWAKVQGRFEDITHVESASATRALIGKTFQVSDDVLRDRIARWAQSCAKAMRFIGIADLADPNVVASCYPLHPVAAMVLPELCSRYGQHERTLFSFLTSADQASATSFLAATELPICGPLPSIGLEAVYDYFVANGAFATMSGGRSSRWTEIATRIRDIHGLSPKQTRLAKAIAVLNLISVAGTVRASPHVLALADARMNETLPTLEAAGVVTYRDFADEYRIWHGTDIDIRRLLEHARERVSQMPLVEILSDIGQPTPVVAARHSAEHDVLRVFARRYASGGVHVKPLDAFSPYDGEVLHVVSSAPSALRAAQPTSRSKPIVAAVPNDVKALDRSAREVAAVTAVSRNPNVEADWVARREVGERLAEAQAALHDAVSTTFNGGTCRWVLVDAFGEKELPAGRGSAALSNVADLAYPSTPAVRNEMLNRTHPTSQGAKARRLLLEAMIEHGSDPNLGLSGYGPEVAMYRAFLERTGLHGPDARNGKMAFRKPTDPSVSPAWDILVEEFIRAKTRRINLNDVYAVLLSPPVGMKATVVPVFVTAALLAFRNEIAIYEHGTFRPLLTPELSERMVRNPGHFDVKHFANTTGARRQVVEALAERLGVRPGFRKHRVANVLTIVGHLVSVVRNLDTYTLRTRNLSPVTFKAREVLAAAIEPDALLFLHLPEALGLDPIPADTNNYARTGAYAERVGTALDELAGYHDKLLADLFDLLLETSAETTRIAVTGQATAIEKDVLNPAVRAFVLTLANDAVDTDAAWIQAVATVVARKAPAEWSDDDLERFRRELPEHVAAFQRLLALHADCRADSGTPFEALRVTITRSDGTEHVRLVGIDKPLRGHVRGALDKALTDLIPALGSPQRAHNALLALLGERLLPNPAATDASMRIEFIERRARRA